MKNYNEQMFQSLSENELMICEGGCGWFRFGGSGCEDLYRPPTVGDFLSLFGF